MKAAVMAAVWMQLFFANGIYRWLVATGISESYQTFPKLFEQGWSWMLKPRTQTLEIFDLFKSVLVSVDVPKLNSILKLNTFETYLSISMFPNPIWTHFSSFGFDQDPVRKMPTYQASRYVCHTNVSQGRSRLFSFSCNFAKYQNSLLLLLHQLPFQT